MKPFFIRTCIRIALITFVFSFFSKPTFAQTQLGTYQFNGLLGILGTCPNLNNNVTSQPANATFSAFTNVSCQCVASANSFDNDHWNGNGGYNTFTITPASGYALTLTSLSFTQFLISGSATSWSVRSSIDNYTNDIALGTPLLSSQTPTINLSPVALPIFVLR